MDLNGDERIDILSGSYSHMEPGRDMAGYFQVLWGEAGGKFRAAEILKGNDDQPLLLPAGAEPGNADIAKICTRAFVADLDDDGNLDLVSGNFGGTFALFMGEDAGGFAPQATWLQAAGKPMQVEYHSDPFLVDWDGDGDLDLLSGSASGGAFLFRNVGNAGEPKFGAIETLVDAASSHATKVVAWQDGVPQPESAESLAARLRFGDAHPTGPSSSTRVWADDVDGDGTLDLLIGDSITLQYPLDGKSDAETRQLLVEWERQQDALMARMQPKPDGTTDATVQDEYREHYERKKQVVREEMTGFVWLLRGKAAGAKRTASN